MPEMNAEHRKLQEEIFEALGVTPDDRQIVNDLAKHAAKQAVNSIDTIAKTVHDPRMMNVVLLSAMMMVGEAAEKAIEDRMSAAIQRMPPELREKFEEVFVAETRPRQAKPTGVRDFDGNYQ